MDVLNSPNVSAVEPQSVPSWILVVLVEEAKSGGAHTFRMECSRVYQDLRLLAGMAKPASVTVCEDSHLSPSAKETLPSPDLAEKLFLVVPAGIPLPAGQVGPVATCGRTSPSELTFIGLVSPNPGPVGPCRRTSPSDLTARGSVGSFGVLSPCDPDQLVADGPVGPHVTRGPVGSYGMLSPCNSDFDPVQPVADGPVGPYVARGPVGSYGMLSQCDCDSDPDQPVADGPVGPYVARGPVSSYGTFSPCDSDTTGPVMPVRTLPLSPQDDGERMDRPGGSSGSNVAETPTAVAVVDLWTGSTVTDVSSNGVDDGDDWDSGYQREIIDGVTVHYGGDLCDSDD